MTMASKRLWQLEVLRDLVVVDRWKQTNEQTTSVTSNKLGSLCSLQGQSIASRAAPVARDSNFLASAFPVQSVNAHGTHDQILKRIFYFFVCPLILTVLSVNEQFRIILPFHYFRIVVFPTRCFCLQKPYTSCLAVSLVLLAFHRYGRFVTFFFSTNPATSAYFLRIASTLPCRVIMFQQWWRHMLCCVIHIMFPWKQLQALLRSIVRRANWKAIQIMFTRCNLEQLTCVSWHIQVHFSLSGSNMLKWRDYEQWIRLVIYWKEKNPVNNKEPSKQANNPSKQRTQ